MTPKYIKYLEYQKRYREQMRDEKERKEYFDSRYKRKDGKKFFKGATP